MQVVGLSKSLYSRKEAAAILGVSVRTLDREIADKQLAVRKIRSRVMIPLEALTAFIKRANQIRGLRVVGQ
jgi:excisionase family DNA binding protein